MTSMKTTNKCLAAIAVIVLLSVFVSFGAAAADDENGVMANGLNKAAEKGGLIKSNEEVPTVEVVVGRYVKAGLSLVGLIFLIIIIYAGLLWLTSGGETDNIKLARKLMINGAIGFAVTMMAYLAATFAIENIGGTLK